MKKSLNNNSKRIPKPVSTLQPAKMKMKIKIKIKVKVKKGENAVKCDLVKLKSAEAEVEVKKNEPADEQGNKNTSENNNMPENKMTLEQNQSDKVLGEAKKMITKLYEVEAKKKRKTILVSNPKELPKGGYVRPYTSVMCKERQGQGVLGSFIKHPSKSL